MHQLACQDYNARNRRRNCCKCVNMSHIFISYSKLNWSYARSLADRLLTEGYDVWIDDRIDYGEDWWRTIVRAIRACSAIVVVMTPESDASRWVQREVTLADQLEKPAYPLLLGGDLLNSENWTMFVRTQYVDVRAGVLPPADFYDRLASSAPRKPSRGAEITETDHLPPLTGFLSEKWQALNPAVELEDVPEPEPVPLEPQWPNLSAILPEPFEWCSIPSGTVTIEYNRSQHRMFDVQEFAIGKYPITRAQFNVFVTAPDGFRDARWWGFSNDARAWRNHWSQAEILPSAQDDLPRTNVNWYEAMAFCWWLTARAGDGSVISLPTEQQWQRAAQGDDNRLFPWGNTFAPNRANTSESHQRRPTSVKQFSQWPSPFGVLDMAGNTWEWCLTEWGTDSINPHGSRDRVLRGGSWGNDNEAARTTCRDYGSPHDRYSVRGFRIVAFRLPNKD